MQRAALAIAGLAACAAIAAGCVRIANGRLPPIQPLAPDATGSVEDRVGDFRLFSDVGLPVSDNEAGRRINAAILNRWQRRGYIAGHTFLLLGRFSGQADYELTLGGFQDIDLSITLKIISSVTGFLVPWRERYTFDLQYTLVDVATGAEYRASVTDGYTTWTQLFLVFAAPFADNGEAKMLDAIADHVYEQLRVQGAFAH